MHTQNVVCSLALVYGRSLQPHKKITKERGCVLELPFAKQSSPWFIMIELPTESLLPKDLCTSAIFFKEKRASCVILFLFWVVKISGQSMNRLLGTAQRSSKMLRDR